MVRVAISEWRDKNDPGASEIIKQLLRYWFTPEMRSGNARKSQSMF